MKDVKEIIKPLEIGCRDFNQIELINVLRRTTICMSWGTHAWRTIKNNALRFAVNGHHHKGHVYISLAANDTFTIHFTTMRGRILSVEKDVYIDDLLNVIDKKVEYISDYSK